MFRVERPPWLNRESFVSGRERQSTPSSRFWDWTPKEANWSDASSTWPQHGAILVPIHVVDGDDGSGWINSARADSYCRWVLFGETKSFFYYNKRRDVSVLAELTHETANFTIVIGGRPIVVVRKSHFSFSRIINTIGKTFRDVSIEKLVRTIASGAGLCWIIYFGAASRSVHKKGFSPPSYRVSKCQSVRIVTSSSRSAAVVATIVQSERTHRKIEPWAWS
jgi:hypothetical protein